MNRWFCPPVYSMYTPWKKCEMGNITYFKHLAKLSLSLVLKQVFSNTMAPKAHHQTLCECTSCVRCGSRVCPLINPS